MWFIKKIRNSSGMAKRSFEKPLIRKDSLEISLRGMILDEDRINQQHYNLVENSPVRSRK
jgi:hypothetical protein